MRSLLRFVVAPCLVACAACGGGGSPAAKPPPAEPLVVPLPAAPPGAIAVEDGPPAGASDLPIAKAPPRERVEETAKRHRSSILDGQPKSARLAPGTYGCRTDAGYKYRPCQITKDAKGFTHIAMPGSLIGFTGVLYDDGAAMIIDGTNAEVRPFGCFSCQERCSEPPGSCFCTEIHVDASRECIEQPLTARLTKVGAIWRGSLSLDMYSNRYEGDGPARHVSGWEKERKSFVVEIAPASSITR